MSTVFKILHSQNRNSPYLRQKKQKNTGSYIYSTKISRLYADYTLGTSWIMLPPSTVNSAPVEFMD